GSRAAIVDLDLIGVGVAVVAEPLAEDEARRAAVAAKDVAGHAAVVCVLGDLQARAADVLVDERALSLGSDLDARAPRGRHRQPIERVLDADTRDDGGVAAVGDRKTGVPEGSDDGVGGGPPAAL